MKLAPPSGQPWGLTKRICGSLLWGGWELGMGAGSGQEVISLLAGRWVASQVQWCRNQAIHSFNSSTETGCVILDVVFLILMI